MAFRWRCSESGSEQGLPRQCCFLRPRASKNHCEGLRFEGLHPEAASSSHNFESLRWESLHWEAHAIEASWRRRQCGSAQGLPGQSCSLQPRSSKNHCEGLRWERLHLAAAFIEPSLRRKECEAEQVPPGTASWWLRPHASARHCQGLRCNEKLVGANAEAKEDGEGGAELFVSSSSGCNRSNRIKGVCENPDGDRGSISPRETLARSI